MRNAGYFKDTKINEQKYGIELMFSKIMKTLMDYPLNSPKKMNRIKEALWIREVAPGMDTKDEYRSRTLIIGFSCCMPLLITIHPKTYSLIDSIIKRIKYFLMQYICFYVLIHP